MKKTVVLILICLLFLSGCAVSQTKGEETKIALSDERILVDGKEISKSPASAVFAARDIVFYLAGQDFTYGEGTEKDGHSQKEADLHTVVHITRPGTYVLSGKLSRGQIAVDLGEKAKKDPEAVVTLVLNGADITCSVAPGIIFYNVYECATREEENATKEVNTEKAGANVIIADGTENKINGSYVAKIYKSYTLSEDKTKILDSKKLHKYDGAFYSKMSMNIGGGEKGDGVLSIKAENEGINSELHLTINGGKIDIESGNDGINTNEDNISVTTINGGDLSILCNGKTGEGDGIDSNGFLVINGGTVVSEACSTSADAGIDSDKGIYLNGGKLMATGNMLDHIAGGEMTYAIFRFKEKQEGNSTYILKNAKGETVGEYTPKNDFTYLILAGEEFVPGEYTFWQGETQLCTAPGGKMMGEMPKGEKPELPEDPFFQGDKNKGEPPEKPKGEKPGFPGGQEFHPNQGGSPAPGQMDTNVGETSFTFTMINGANHFYGVSSCV